MKIMNNVINGWSIDHPLHKKNIGIKLHFYFGTFMQKQLAIYKR